MSNEMSNWNKLVIRDKITISYNGDKTVCFYDHDAIYFTVILDVAYLTLIITPAENTSDKYKQS